MSTKSDSLALCKAVGLCENQGELVLVALRSVGPMTRDQLHHWTGIRVSSLCAALHALVKRGLVDDTVEVHNAETNRRVKQYKAT